MRTVTAVATMVCALAIPIAACGSSGSGSGGGADSGVGPESDSGGLGAGDAGGACDAGDAGSAGRRCTLSMPVQGGLTGTIDGQTGCGDGNSAATGAYVTWDSSTLGARVTAYFQSGLPKQTGAYPLTSLTIRAGSADGGSQSWTAPAGACTIAITNVDVECQAVLHQMTTVLYGTGTCMQPATPDMGTNAAAITIGDFPFEHWL